jgi:hypothetical protein
MLTKSLLLGLASPAKVAKIAIPEHYAGLLE